MPDELDPLRSAFDDLRAATLPAMRPPGVDKVTATVRHRRNVRTVVAGAVTLVLVGTGLWAGLGVTDHGHPAATAAPSLAVSPPVLILGPSAAPSISAPPSPSASTQLSIRRPTTRQTTAKSKSCVTDGVAVAGEGEASEEFSSLGRVQMPPCAGVKIPLFWASYTLNPDGTGSLFASGTGDLDAAHTYVTLPVRKPGTCASVFVGFYWSGIPASVAAAVMGEFYAASAGQPFWDRRQNRSGLTIDYPLQCPDPSPSD